LSDAYAHIDSHSYGIAYAYAYGDADSGYMDRGSVVCR